MTTQTRVLWASRHLSRGATLFLGGATLIITIAASLRNFILPDQRTLPDELHAVSSGDVLGRSIQENGLFLSAICSS